MQAMEISRSALNVEWQRLEIIAQNIANVNSARGKDGTLYREHNLISGPRAPFASYLQTQIGAAGAEPSTLSGVGVLGIEESDAPPRLEHEPGNPLADAQGMVAYPNIDHASQMLQMVKASRAYEANIVIMNSAGQMYVKALELGRR